MAAIELDEVLLDPAPNADDENDELSNDEPPVDAGSWGGWWRRRKRAPEGVRNADIYAAAGG